MKEFLYFAAFVLILALIVKLWPVILIGLAIGIVWYFANKAKEEKVDDSIINDPAINNIIDFCHKCKEIKDRYNDIYCGYIFISSIGYDGRIGGNPARAYEIKMSLFDAKNKYYLWAKYFYEGTKFDGFYNNPARWIDSIDTDKFHAAFGDGVSIGIDEHEPDDIFIKKIVAIKSPNKIPAYAKVLMARCRSEFLSAKIEIDSVKTGLLINF